MDNERRLLRITNDFIIKVGKNLGLVERLMNEVDLESWWGNLDEVWQNIFLKTMRRNDIASINPNSPSQVALQDLIKVENIYCVDTGIKSVEPLQIFKRLRDINLMMCTDLESIQPLRNNIELRKLNIFDTKVTNIEIIEQFPHLEELYLSDLVTDIKPISGLFNLKRLFFRKCFLIRSLEPISKLINLEEIAVSDSVVDLSPIDHFNNLRRIVCYGVSGKEAERFKRTHPHTVIEYGEKGRKENERIIAALNEKAEKIRKGEIDVTKYFKFED